MAKVQIQPTLTNANGLEEVKRFGDMITQAIIRELNGRLQFVANIAAAGPYEVTFVNGTDPVQVRHSFGQVPQGFLVINLSAGIFVYKPASFEWTTTRIWLQASAAGVATIYLV